MQDTAEAERVDAHSESETPAEALNRQVAAEVATRNSTPRTRYRPTTAEGDQLKAENLELKLQLSAAKFQLADVLARAWKWNALIASISAMVGAVLGKAFGQ